MSLAKICLILVCVCGGVWATMMVVGLMAVFPFGLPLLLGLSVLAFVLVRVIRERLGNAEDDYYERNIRK